MALHDFVCPACGTVRCDIYVPVTLGASHAEVYCRACDADLHQMIRMDPIPAIGRMSVFSQFEKFTTPIEDPASPTGYRDVSINTLGDIRRLERESEQAERNGEGRRMIWRSFSQDPSNADVHTMGPDPSLKPAKTYTNGQPVLVRRGDPVVADHGAIED